MFDSYRENTLRYYPGRCINCKRCTQVCPHAVFDEGEKQARLARPPDCMECGACALNCPTQAIEVESGVGCAWAMIHAALRGRDMDSCSCGGPDAPCCGGDGGEETTPRGRGEMNGRAGETPPVP
jgi:NAD-dependent dihydropyrimidine dehydrogenase PreA subunit